MRRQNRKTVPKIFYTNTSYEYWGRAASLIHTTADGKTDAPLAQNTRIYFLAGLEHFTVPFPPENHVGGNPDYTAQQKANPNPIQWYWRALITDMDQWVKDGKQPPPSTYPKIAEKTLVPLGEWKFPKIPGVNTPHEVSMAYQLNFEVRQVDKLARKASVSPERKKLWSRRVSAIHLASLFRRVTPTAMTWAACACLSCKFRWRPTQDGTCAIQASARRSSV